MSAKKKLNIGLVGAGFMGRTHSNAFAKVNQFFELDTQPVLKAVCARNAAGAKAFAANWGYEAFETDWRDLISREDIDLIDIASPNDTHAEIAIAAAQAGKMVMCEKPLGRNAAEAETDGRGRRSGEPSEHGLVQLPPRSRGHAGQATGRRGAARAHLSLSRQIPAGLDDLRRSSAGRDGPMAARRERRRQRRHRRSARPLHRYRDVAERADRHGHRDDRDFHQGARPQPHRQGSRR